MSDLFQAYASEIHRELDFSAAWPVGTSLSLGDVLVEDDGVYHREGGAPIEFETHHDTGTDDEFTFQSQQGVDIQFKAAGAAPSGIFEVIGQAEAGAAVAFSRDQAVVFAMHDVAIDQIDQLDQFKHDLEELAKNGGLRPDNAVIVELITAGSGTVLVSRSREAKAEIRAAVNIGQVTDLGSVQAGLSLARSKDVGIKVVARERLTPLFRAVRLRRDFWEWLLGDLGHYEIDAFGPIEIHEEDFEGDPFEPIVEYRSAPALAPR